MRNKILIVDDVDINREILRSILEDEYTILEAENGKQALEIVDQEAKNMIWSCRRWMGRRCWKS